MHQSHIIPEKCRVVKRQTISGVFHLKHLVNPGVLAANP
jgi:hypothetical protein